MRLLDTRTGKLREVNNPADETYAILSHVWSIDGEEQTFHDLLAIQKEIEASDSPTASILSHPRISPKIERACAIALSHGYELLWIDSCCIDKTSSAELSEAINSMFQWYASSSMCYVYLADVDVAERGPLNGANLPEDDDKSADHRGQEPHEHGAREFCSSKWHRRGWTLQELIAPYSVLFISARWTVLGSKLSMIDIVEKASGVDRDILLHNATLDSVSVARRMWWASSRITTRVEDEAYCLMGIFGVHLPTIYGEGRRAFLRLQQEIFHTVTDHSLFAWELTPHFPFEGEQRHKLDAGQLETVNGLFAFSPHYFALSKDISPISHEKFLVRFQAPVHAATPPPFPAYTIGARGVRGDVVLFRGHRDKDHGALNLVILECEDRNHDLVALCLQPDAHKPGFAHTDLGSVIKDLTGEPPFSSRVYRLYSITQEALRSPRTTASTLPASFRLQPPQPAFPGSSKRITLSISSPLQTRPSEVIEVTDASPCPSGVHPPHIKLIPYPWCQELLRTHGLHLRCLDPAVDSGGATLQLALERRKENGDEERYLVAVETRWMSDDQPTQCSVSLLTLGTGASTPLSADLDSSSQDTLSFARTSSQRVVPLSSGGDLCEFILEEPSRLTLRMWVEEESGKGKGKPKKEETKSTSDWENRAMAPRRRSCICFRCMPDIEPECAPDRESSTAAEGDGHLRVLRLGIDIGETTIRATPGP